MTIAPGTHNLRHEDRRGVLTFVLCGLPLILLWFPGVGIGYVLAAQVATFFAAARVAYRLWPDGVQLSESARRLVPVFTGVALFVAVQILLGQWSFGEYIAMPMPAVALILMIPRARQCLTKALRPNRHDNQDAHSLDGR